MELQADHQLRTSLARKIEAWRNSDSAAAGGTRALIAAAKREADVALIGAMKRALTMSNPADPKAIHAILLKPVADHCNLRCRYCYEGIGSERFQPGQMSPRVLRKTITEGCEQAPANRIQFLWHGGEPLLAGRALFQVGVDQQRVEKDRLGIEISNSVQTNGTLLDAAWLEFFEEAGFAIGISLDGPRDIHDTERVDSKGQGTHHAVVDAIRRIQERQLDFGVIAVITPRHVPHAARVVRHFHDLGVRNLDMHPAVGLPQKGGAAASTDLCPDGFARFMADAFDEWLAIGDLQFRINIFADFLRGWFGARPRTCYFNGSCGSILAVEANGAVVPCTRPFDREVNTFGNLLRNSVREVSAGPALEDFRQRDRRAIDRTKGCRWGAMCSGGCPQHRRTPSVHQTEDVAGDNPFCKCMTGNDGGHDALWSHIVDRIDAIFED